MSWRDTAAATLRNAEEGADYELTKPTKPPFVSVVSEVPPHIPEIADEPTLEEIARLDDFIRRLAAEEGWPEGDLAKALAARKRMALARVNLLRRALEAAYSDAVGVWPNPPPERQRIAICEF